MCERGSVGICCHDSPDAEVFDPPVRALALVGTVKHEAARYQVAFRNLDLIGAVVVGESPADLGYTLFELRGDIGGHEFVEGVKVSAACSFRSPPDEGLVLFRRHTCPFP